MVVIIVWFVYQQKTIGLFFWKTSCIICIKHAYFSSKELLQFGVKRMFFLTKTKCHVYYFEKPTRNKMYTRRNYMLEYIVRFILSCKSANNQVLLLKNRPELKCRPDMQYRPVINIFAKHLKDKVKKSKDVVQVKNF